MDTTEEVCFGIRLPVYGKFPVANPFDLIRTLTTTADQGGIASVWVVDHFSMPDESIAAAGGVPGKNAPLEAWTTLIAAAAWTSSLRLGTEVTPMTRWHPSILAKVTSTLDVLSKGRVILGAGAGWFPPEFKAFGLPWYRLDHRFERMYESIEVIKKLWIDDAASYDGKYYTLRNAQLLPKPIQKPHPPIWFGGQSDRILRSVVKYGGGWIPANNTSPDEYEALSKRLKTIASEAQRDVSEITLSGPFLTQIDRDHSKVRRSIREYSRKAAGGKEASGWNTAFGRTLTYGMWGTPKECIQRMETYIGLGVQHFILDLLPPTTALTSIELLCKEIIPHFRHK